MSSQENWAAFRCGVRKNHSCDVQYSEETLDAEMESLPQTSQQAPKLLILYFLLAAFNFAHRAR